jgi:surface protein
LRISPTNFQRIIFNNGNNGGGDKNRLLDVEQWGTTSWTSFQQAFFGCTNLNITATGIPNITNVKDMSDMFQGCSNLSTVPNMGSWNVSEVTNMTSLFNNASKFNENISGWNTAKVVALTNTFNNASAFNQNLGGWKVNSIGSNGINLSGSGMDCDNYTATLIGWNSTCSTAKRLQANGLKYAPSLAARASLVTNGWNITGDAGTGSCSAPQGLVQMIDFGGFIKHDVTNLDKPLNVYPNPATDFINLEFKGIAPSTFNVLVMDMSGKVIIKLDGVHAESNQYTLPLNGIVSGMYVVKLSDELGNTTINRFNIK